MDVHSILIMIKSKQTGMFEDKTAEIRRISGTAVTFACTGRTYQYNSANVRVFTKPKEIDASSVVICVDGFPIRDYSMVLDFGEYIKLFDDNQKTTTYHKSKIKFQKSCLGDKRPKAVFNYLRELSRYVCVFDDGKAVLFDQYKKLNKVSEKSVLATYLSGSAIRKRIIRDTLIFPFGSNLSQRKAVRAALENSISIIEGPPGTGKTQTILNIVANAVSRGQTVAVVSGNNSATSNVQEKLEKNGYGFVTALLGSSKNKEEFFNHKQSDVPVITDWAQKLEQMQASLEKLNSITNDLTMLMEDKNRIAKLQEELAKLEIEQTYFEANFRGQFIAPARYSYRHNWSSHLIVAFLNDFERFVTEGQDQKFAAKAFLFFKYGIYKFKYAAQNQSNIVSSLKKIYYEASIREKRKAITRIKARLASKNYQELMEQHINISAQIFRAALYRQYARRTRDRYTVKNFKYKFDSFIEDYPVILSTTHSIKNSISENYLFDYLIIDEASQVDLVTAALALSCCRNVVIVGDVNQLPQIVPTEIEKKSTELFHSGSLNKAYNYSQYSIIGSLMELYKKDLPKTLLCEHYRCHPKIIGFCNEKFYNNQLVIMTEENPEDTPLRLYTTAPGNHARKDKVSKEKGWYNLRQIEVVRDEIFGAREDRYIDSSTVGVIAPYRKHVMETRKYLGLKELEVDTVHKFQGREKDTIIFTTVANDITPFVDDANLINVAVSRAVKELIIVTSNKLFKQHGTNIGDLIRYIVYNSPKTAVVESQKISVFDLLYSEYSDRLLGIMNSATNVSRYKSENLMYRVIEEVISCPQFSSFKCVLHISLSSIVKDFSNLSDSEKAFAQNPWTHVDFLIFNKLDKEPVLVVEVDGHENHRNSKKQRHRDAMKDKILSQVGLPVLRIATNESGEKERLVEALGMVVEFSVGEREDQEVASD